MSQLAWQCRRGMRELDDLLLEYLQKHYDNATETDKWVKEWEKWTEEPVDEPDAKDAVKRRVLSVRKIGSR